MKIGSLFSGVGGLELGLEWAGLGPTIWQVEKEPFCREVLAKHWPDAVRFDDVCAVGAHNLPDVDLICGGPPCQDLSKAGRKAGISGARSGLWFEFARIIRELRPRFVVVENVAEMLDRGVGEVLGSLAALGYYAEWSTVSACAVGAPHMRHRLFIVAYANGVDGSERVRDLEARRGREALQPRHDPPMPRPGRGSWMENPSSLYRGADGVSARLDRLRALGNSVVPQVGYVIGCALRRIAGEELL